MGKIYYLIPDIHKKEFRVKDLIKSIFNGSSINYIQNKIFRKHKPVGGIKVMYQHCILLQKMDYQAYPLVMGDYVGNFFGYDLDIKYINDVGYNLTEDDIVISPEFQPYLGIEFKGCTRLLFNQSQTWRYYNDFLKKGDIGKNYFDLGYDHIITCSEHLCRMLKTKMNIDSTAITNGIDQNKFFPLPGKRVKGRILALSRKHPEHINTIKQATKDLGFEFRVVDGLTENELIDEYQQADIFLATGYPEGLPLPQLEAMNCGCIVVGFSGGGGDEYMMDGITALVAEDGDCDSIIVKLQMLNKDNKLKEIIREGGMKKASHYTLENTKNMLYDFYSNMKLR